MTNTTLFSWLLGTAVILSGCTVQNTPVTGQAAGTETERLNAWFETHYEESLQFSPLELTALGRKDRYDEIDDVSDAALDAQLAWSAETVDDLKRRFDYDALTDEARLSYDIWVYQHERAVEAAAFRDHEFVFDQMGGAQSWLPTFMINFHRVDDLSDMEAYIKRLSGAAEVIDTLRERAAANAAKGVRPPRFAYEGVIDQSGKVITGVPFDNSDDESALWADATAKIDALVENGTASGETADRLRAATREALQSDFQGAYQRLIAWLRSDIDNTTEPATGVHTLPRGESYYRERLKAYTSTDLTPDAIHQLGIEEVARLRGDMEAVREEVGFDGDLQAFFEYLRTGDRFFFPDTDAGRQMYLDEATARIDFIRDRLPDYFGLLPKAELVVKRVEAFRERDGAAQHYNAGTPDGSRPGVYYVHLSDMTAMPTNQLEVIAYHEGLPGHHMQISIAQELTGLPTFRTQAHFGAYVEGWALYSEWLAREMGAYEDPYAEFGRLSSELWRAIRLVVDTGLHAMGWTEADAIAYFKANSPEPEESIVSEVRRYIVMPGQATGYKIGMLKIQDLRRAATARLGEDFDVRAFHDTVLGGGALPLGLLERRVDQWVVAAGSDDGA